MFEIGATLREARERRQLTWEQVEADTKIRAKYLRALEEEELAEDHAFRPSHANNYVNSSTTRPAGNRGRDGACPSRLTPSPSLPTLPTVR